MLILRRKAGEAISIGDGIRVVIVEIHGNQIKVGVDAPIGVPVYRDEVLAKIKAENLKSAKTFPDFFQTEFIQEIMKKVEKQHEAGGGAETGGENNENGN
ncbi:MAG: carbon storage regulator [Nitrospiria bacterium]